MGDDRPAVYWEDEKLIIRASGIGHPCLWELIATGQSLISLPYPALLLRAFAEGNLLEPVIIKRMEQHELTFLSHQTENELWLSDRVAIRYHPDGIAHIDSLRVHTVRMAHPRIPLPGDNVITNTKVVFEAKALTNSLWQRAVAGSTGDVLDEYNWQLSAMMHDTGLPGLWAVYNKGLPPDEHGNREPCDDAGKIHLEYVEEPPVSMQELQLKASLILNGVEGPSLLDTDKGCDSPDHWPCLYLHLRPELEAATRSVYLPNNKDEVDDLVRTFITFKGMYDEAEAKYKAARDELIRMAGDAGYIQTDKFYVPIIRSSSSTVNRAAMGQELRELFDSFKVKRPYKFIRNVRRLQ